jgi:hypothetical protein
VERITTLNQDLADTLFIDASDAPQRLGAESSSIYENLKLALELKRALDSGLDTTIRELQNHRQDIEGLPSSGAPGDLKRELSEDLENLSERLKKEDFFKHAADLNSLLTRIKGRVREAVKSLGEQQRVRLKDSVEDLQRLPEWAGLTQEERANAVAQLEELELTAPDDLSGLKKLIAQDYDISSTIEELRRSISRQHQERRRQELEDEAAKSKSVGSDKLSRLVSLPAKIVSVSDIDALIGKLTELKAQIALYEEFDVSFVLDGND